MLVVANGCTDDTVSIVRGLMTEFPMLELMDVPTAIGKGGAVRAGMTVGDEAFVAFVDADGSAKAPQLELLVRECSETSHYGAIGSRWLAGSTISRKQPLKRRIASRTFNAVVRLMFGLSYSDTQCGAKVFRRESIVGVLDHLEIANFAFDVDLLVAMRRFQFPVKEVPIVWADEPENSKVAIVTAGSTMLTSLVRLWIGRSPFAFLPFIDRIGRAGAIPVMRGLDVLVLTREGDNAATAEILRAIRSGGHRARVYRIDGIVAAARFAWWYLAFGQGTYDIIVDVMGNRISRLARLSAKPRIVAQSAADLLRADIDSELAAATKACGYHAVFWRGDDGWILPIPHIPKLAQPVER